MATASAKPATAQKKGKKVASDHPGYEEMIVDAVKALADKKGSSRQAIAKFIKKNFTVPENVEVRIKLALKRMEKKGSLTHTKGSGASGSFKVTESKKPAKKPTKSPKKVKKPATPKKTAKPKTTKKKTAVKPSAAKPSAAKPSAAKEKTKTASKKTTPSKKPSPASPKKAGSPKNMKKASKTKNVKKGSPKKGSKKGGKAAKK